jgi:hypothetical protein
MSDIPLLPLLCLPLKSFFDFPFQASLVFMVRGVFG